MRAPLPLPPAGASKVLLVKVKLTRPALALVRSTRFTRHVARSQTLPVDQLALGRPAGSVASAYSSSAAAPPPPSESPPCVMHVSSLISLRTSALRTLAHLALGLELFEVLDPLRTRST